MTPHIMAGITGYRLTLNPDPVNERCSVTFPGYPQVIAELPLDTIDAIFTSKGMLIHMDSKREVRALPIPNYREVYKAAVSSDEIPGVHDSKVGRYPHPMTRQQALAALGDAARNQISASRIVAGSPSTGKMPGDVIECVTEEMLTEMVRPILHKLAAEMIQRSIDPLRQRLAQLAEENRRMTAKLEAMEKAKTMPSPEPESPDRSWSDRAGLPNGLVGENSPFVTRKPNR